MNPSSIAVISLNPAIDWVGDVSNLQLGEVNRVTNAEFLPAGKGVNVAKVLAKLGASVTIGGFLGQENAQPFECLFRDMKIDDRCVRVQGATRVNLKLLSRETGATECNFEGMTVSRDECALFETQLVNLLCDHDIFVVTGSLPKGVSIAQAKQWLQMLVDANKRVFFDASGEWLAAGILAKPYLIKPNESELQGWVGDQGISSNQAMKRLTEKGVQNAVLSLGAKGACWWDGEKAHLATPHPQTVISTVGAGDTLVAGLCYGEWQGWSSEHTLAFAVALSSLSVTHRGVGEDSLADALALLTEIQVRTMPLDDDFLA